MNPLLRKEIRLLLPAWIGAMAAATLPLWFGKNERGLSELLLCLAMLFLALSPFGQEMNCGTFGFLLAQPEKRLRFWRVKAGLLALALLSAWLWFAFGCWICQQEGARSFQDGLRHALAETAVVALVAFSGGLWTTLLLRDVTTAFFATVLAPLAVLSATNLCLSGLHAQTWMNNATLTLYAMAGFFRARHLFLRAEDVPPAWTGGQISMPKMRGLPLRWLAFGFQKKRGPWSALIIKELRLQESMMVIALLILLSHLAALATNHFAPDWAGRMQVFEFAWFLWLVASFLVGCLAVAEERRCNTLESHFCLPVRKRSQFLVKFAVVMALGMLLGGVAPWVLENIAGGNRQWIGTGALTGVFLPVAALVTAISFFASTMSRGMVQAFIVALLFPIALAVSADLLLENFLFGSYALVLGGRLFSTLVWPALLASYFWLAFRNFKQLQTGWRLWAGNFIRLAVVFASVMLAAGAIFDRSWELFMSLEPSHGPARLSGPGRAVIAASGMGGYCFALLPDGRLWSGKTDLIEANQALKNLSGHFVDGSNWVDLASARTGGAVALKSAGTLWRLSRNTAPSQIGSDTGWKKVVAGPSFFLALKQDGTIWGWGDNESEILAKRQVKDDRNRRFSNPVQVWPNSDWADVFEPVFGRAIAVKRDGSLWSWGNGGMNVNRPDPNNPSFHQLVRMSITGTNWSSILDLNNLGLGIGADGRLMLWAVGGNPGFVQERAASRLFGSPIPWDGVVQPVQLGEKTDWMNLCLGGIQVLALEADGSFWAIDRSTIKARQPSKHHDWLAVSGDAQTIWALARDGTVVCWSDFSRENPYDEDKDHWIQLRPSRRPLADINILDSK